MSDRLFYSSRVVLTNTLGEQIEVGNYSFQMSQNSNIKTFNLTTKTLDSSMVSKFNVGTTIDVWTNKRGKEKIHLFHGVVLEYPRQLDGKLKTFHFSGADFLAKTQNVIVNEVFENWNVTDIFTHLVSTYAPFLSIGYVQPVPYTIEKIVFKDEFLFTALERLSDTIGFSFHCDNDKKIHFKQKMNQRTNQIIKKNMFHKGSADFQISTSQMVNRLIAYGGQTTSLDFTEYFTGDGKNHTYSLKHKPRGTEGGGIQLINETTGVTLNVGAENLHSFDSFDVLVNYGEKLVKFDETKAAPTNNFKIVYRYDYPLKFVENDMESQATYGIYEDVLTFQDVDTRLALRDRAKEHVQRYSKPLLTGSLSPFDGLEYDVNTEVKIEIDELGVNDYLLITGKETSIENGVASFQLQFEQQPTMSLFIKSIHERLKELEKDKQDEVIEKFASITEQMKVSDIVTFTETSFFIVGVSEVGDSI